MRVTFIFRKCLLTSEVYTVFKIFFFYINEGPDVKHWLHAVFVEGMLKGFQCTGTCLELF